jgi:hypothetical protein
MVAAWILLSVVILQWTRRVRFFKIVVWLSSSPDASFTSWGLREGTTKTSSSCTLQSTLLLVSYKSTQDSIYSSVSTSGLVRYSSGPNMSS